MQEKLLWSSGVHLNPEHVLSHPDAPPQERSSRGRSPGAELQGRSSRGSEGGCMCGDTEQSCQGTVVSRVKKVHQQTSVLMQEVLRGVRSSRSPLVFTTCSTGEGVRGQSALFR